MKKTKRTITRLKETRVGDSTMHIGLTVVFGKNEEAWRGKITDMGTLRNGTPLYHIKNAVSDSGKVQSFNIEDKEIIKIISDLEIEHGFYG